MLCGGGGAKWEPPPLGAPSPLYRAYLQTGSTNGEQIGNVPDTSNPAHCRRHLFAKAKGVTAD